MAVLRVKVTRIFVSWLSCWGTGIVHYRYIFLLLPFLVFSYASNCLVLFLVKNETEIFFSLKVFSQRICTFTTLHTSKFIIQVGPDLCVFRVNAIYKLRPSLDVLALFLEIREYIFPQIVFFQAFVLFNPFILPGYLFLF